MGNVYNAVYSVKGGCGKTAFSILLSYYLSEKSGKGRKVCLVDTDIMGSSMLNAFLPFSAIDEISEFVTAHNFINDIVDLDKLADTSRFFVNTNDLEKLYPLEQTISEDSVVMEKKGFEITFCSPKSSDINKFRIGEEGGFETDIFHQMFRADFCSFINNNFGSKKHIVFDMPPGSDGFSNIVFNSVFETNSINTENNHIGNEEDTRNLFFIINLDYGSIFTVLRELQTLMKKSKIKFPDNIVIVINSTTPLNEELLKDLPYERIRYLAEKINEMLIDMRKTEYDSINFIKVEFNQKYWDALCMRGGLAKTHLSQIFRDIVRIDTYGMSDIKQSMWDEKDSRELFDVLNTKRR